MNRLGIVAHYDAQGEVKDYVLYLLAKLRPLCGRLVFVSTAALDLQARTRALAYCDDVQVRENAGFDFGMWQSALSAETLEDFDALLLTNSSVFGPVFDLEPIVRRMEADHCDFWSMTESFDLAWHLQSYFLGFKSCVLRSPDFSRFWATVLPWRDKMQVIRSCEVGLSVHLSECGFVGCAVFPMRAVVRFGSLAGPGRAWRGNPTAWYPARLLDCGMPFVKVNVLRDNPSGVRLAPVRRRIRQSGYDERLIQFDRAPLRRTLRSSLRHPVFLPMKRLLSRGWRIVG